MFSGSWSALPAPTTPAPSSGGGWGSGPGGGSWGSGPASAPVGSVGTWGLVTTQQGSAGTFTAAVSPIASALSPSYFAPPGYSLPYNVPAPGVAARGALGEGGPYTELDYPEMRFLRAGENPTELLSSLRAQQARGKLTPVGWGVLALILFATLKGR